MSAKLEKFRYYLGTAKIRLVNLCYKTTDSDPDECVGCCISDLEHNLPALISYPDYENYLNEAGITTHVVYAVGCSPKLALPDGVQLPCLHGQFRLETAKRDTSQNQEEWWLVDLYNKGENIIVLLSVGC